MSFEDLSWELYSSQKLGWCAPLHSLIQLRNWEILLLDFEEKDIQSFSWRFNASIEVFFRTYQSLMEYWNRILVEVVIFARSLQCKLKFGVCLDKEGTLVVLGSCCWISYCSYIIHIKWWAHSGQIIPSLCQIIPWDPKYYEEKTISLINLFMFFCM